MERRTQGDTPAEVILSQLARAVTAQAVEVEDVVQLAVLSQQLAVTDSLQSLRNLTTYVLLGIFAIGNVATITLYSLNGFGVTNLSDVAMASLGAATIAEVAGLLVIVVKGLFEHN